MGAPGPLTDKQEALGPRIDIQEPLANNQGAPGPLTDDQGDMGPLTDDQGSRARGPAIRIFNNIYAKTYEKSKSYNPRPSFNVIMNLML